MGTEVPGLWRAEDAIREVAHLLLGSSKALSTRTPRLQPYTPRYIHSPGQRSRAVNPQMNRHFRNIQILARPTLKLHFISLCAYLLLF